MIRRWQYPPETLQLAVVSKRPKVAIRSEIRDSSLGDLVAWYLGDLVLGWLANQNLVNLTPPKSHSELEQRHGCHLSTALVNLERDRLWSLGARMSHARDGRTAAIPLLC